jgi:hypothetical protein
MVRKPKKSKSDDKPNRRKAVPRNMRLRLYREAGNKCANPGCPNTLLELHHIDEWHIYRTHDESTMIAICPACHEAAHRGDLRIDDATILRWKRIVRKPSNRGHIYVEPAGSSRLLLASIYLTNGPRNAGGATVFELSPQNRLSFRIVDGEILHLNVNITNTNGVEIVRVADGHLKYDLLAPILCENRPGKFRLTAPATPEFLPAWVLERYNESRPVEPFAENGRFTILDIETLFPRGRPNSRSLDAWPSCSFRWPRLALHLSSPSRFRPYFGVRRLPWRTEES